MNYQKIGNRYLLVLKRGEKITEQLTIFLEKEKIKNGQIEAIGAVDKVELAHYSVSDQKYSSFYLEEPLEMTSLLGNFFLGENNRPIIHLHGSFARKNGETFSGHFVEGTISGTAEIFITPLNSSFRKKFDPETGLKILNL